MSSVNLYLLECQYTLQPTNSLLIPIMPMLHNAGRIDLFLHSTMGCNTLINHVKSSLVPCDILSSFVKPAYCLGLGRGDKNCTTGCLRQLNNALMPVLFNGYENALYVQLYGGRTMLTAHYDVYRCFAYRSQVVELKLLHGDGAVQMVGVQEKIPSTCFFLSMKACSLTLAGSAQASLIDAKYDSRYSHKHHAPRRGQGAKSVGSPRSTTTSVLLGGDTNAAEVPVILVVI
ncbi:hypothetical protein KCU78_g24, partial [Aureobasidium melanogenum]